ncbi:MAG: THUMP domain-containing protein [Desulfobulbaceae bacterium]|nr:THUMP domain-containing protein [Desulfobulbaceae bacterium]HIJ79169.1 class I SAM-dependent RNA methyltransferase [Deltaproteobacteria bacterium]
MFTYQKTGRYFAQVAENIEEVGAEELRGLGAVEVMPAFRGIYFNADPAALYRIVYATRLCTRVMAPLLTFDCHSTKYLYQTAMKLPWDTLIKPGQTFAITSNVSHSKIRHSKYAALCLKDAMVDWLREKWGERPNVDTVNPDVAFNLHIHEDKAVISMDVAGESLHRRGYRKEAVKAPMQETVAAAIVNLSGWDGSRPLVDPMCGSGTLLCEAYLAYCRIPGGFLRDRFGFFNLPDFDEKIWQRVKAGVDDHIRPLGKGIEIRGSDIDYQAVAAARHNLENIPGASAIRIRECSFQDLEPINDSVIVVNPPYGIRMGEKEEVAAMIGEFGSFLKHKCAGSTAYLYFGDRELLKKIGLRPAWKKSVKNGGLDGVLAKYEMY